MKLDSKFLNQTESLGRRINDIERLSFLTILFVCLFLVLSNLPSIAQEDFKSLTVLYTNNINAEIDPCPT